MAELCNGRDERGRFAKGNVGGPGNPFARQTAKFRALLVSSVSQEEFEAVTAKLIELAKGGDVATIKLFLAYIVGKPTPAVDIDRVDLEEWKIFKEEADMAKEADVEKVITTMAPRLVLQMGREVKANLGKPHLVEEVDGLLDIKRRQERGEIEVREDYREKEAGVVSACSGSRAEGDGAPCGARGEVACNGDGEGEKPNVSPLTNGVLSAAAAVAPRQDGAAPAALGDWTKSFASGWMDFDTSMTVLRETREKGLTRREARKRDDAAGGRGSH